MVKARKRDFGTLRTEQIAYSGLAEFEAAGSDAEKIETLAGIILETFDDYYSRSRRIPWLAKRAFELRDWPGAIELSHERIAIYSVSISKIAPILKQALHANQQVDGFWDQVETAFRKTPTELEPFPPAIYGWWIPFRASAKNRNGVYGPRRALKLFVRDDEILSVWDDE